ncbi:glutamate-gated chloride channel-like [Ylistrum balloti]|uniref:glutamate-gated chloride channel-like n=1 Tax=Ylistrum balloti TaxID=509963 RepID=UPI002905B427|nr:glutamate-gated chloride channel-like [Ylistrum balloti]
MAGYLAFLNLLLVSYQVQAACNISWETLNERLSQETYNFYNPPWSTNGGESIDVRLKVGISQIKSTEESDITLTLHVLQTWNDPRVCFNVSSLPSGQTTAALVYRNHGLLWNPDVYPEGAVMSTQHDIILPNIFIRIQPNGTVLKSNRLSLQITCPSSDSKFPHGNQRCTVRFKSYSFTKDEISLSWLNGGFEMLEDLSSNVDVEDIIVDTCKHVLFLDEQPCVELSLLLRRNFDVYLVRIYLPSAVVVFLSWISLWIDVRQVPARTGLSVVCVLSLMTQTVGLMVISDDDGDVLAVDAWLMVCLLFTVWALVTFIIAHYEDSASQRKAQAADKLIVEEGKKPKRKACTSVRYKRLERIVKFLYPTSFVVFNLIYWAYFLSV